MPIVARAGAAIMRIYDSGFTVQHKEDNSPLTLADLESQRVIIEGLTTVTPGVPILSEESAQAPWAERQAWRELWVVDPSTVRASSSSATANSPSTSLGGGSRTRAGSGLRPAKGLLYWEAPASVLSAAMTAQRKLRSGWPTRSAPARRRQPFALESANRRLSGAARTARDDGNRQFPEILPDRRWQGRPLSALRPNLRMGHGGRQALLEAAGGRVTLLDGHRLRYNCRESVINGDFLAFSNPSVLPSR